MYAYPNPYLTQVFDVYRKIRTTTRFLLGTLADFDPSTDTVAYDDLPALDKYMLQKNAAFVATARDAFEQYQFFRLYQAIQSWCASDLSNFYLDASKDRLYLAKRSDRERRACQTVLASVTTSLLAAVAPILPHMAEDAWLAMPEALRTNQNKTEGKPSPSVFLAGWAGLTSTTSSSSDTCTTSTLVEDWDALRAVRDVALKALEAARREKVVGASLDAKVTLYVESAEWRARLQDAIGSDGTCDGLDKVLIVSEAAWAESEPAVEEGMFMEREEVEAVGGDVVAVVARAGGQKCERCWGFRTLGGVTAHPTLCDRCGGVVVELGVDAQFTPAV